MTTPTVTAQPDGATRMRYADFEGTLADVAQRKGATTQWSPELFDKSSKQITDEFLTNIGGDGSFAYVLQLTDAATPRMLPTLLPREKDEAIEKLGKAIKGTKNLSNLADFKPDVRTTANTNLLLTCFTQLLAAANGDLATLRKWFEPESVSSLPSSAGKVDVYVDYVLRCAGAAARKPASGTQPLGGGGVVAPAFQKEKIAGQTVTLVTSAREDATFAALLTVPSTATAHLGKLHPRIAVDCVGAMLETATSYEAAPIALRRGLNVFKRHTDLSNHQGTDGQLALQINDVVLKYQRATDRGETPEDRPIKFARMLIKIPELKEQIDALKDEWSDDLEDRKDERKHRGFKRAHDGAMGIYYQHEDAFQQLMEEIASKRPRQSPPQPPQAPPPGSGVPPQALKALREAIAAKFGVSKEAANPHLMRMLQKQCAVCQQPIQGYTCANAACKVGPPNQAFTARVAAAGRLEDL